MADQVPAGSIVVGDALMTPEVLAMMPAREADHPLDPCRCGVCVMATNIMQGVLDCQEMQVEDEVPTLEDLDNLPWADLMHVTMCRTCSTNWRENEEVAYRLDELRRCLVAGVNLHNRAIIVAHVDQVA